MPKANAATKRQDAVTLLTEDHKRIKQLFKQFEKLHEAGDGDDEQKASIVATACAELTIHAGIEEEIFYPAARKAIDDEDLLDEAEVEHASAKDLIAQLAEMQPGDPLYAAKFTVLGEYIEHHVKEEQDEMFPKVKKSGLDLAALGEQLAQRREELMAEIGLSEGAGESEDEDEAPARTAPRKGSGRTQNQRRAR